jgi:hypothetical protein
MITRHGSQNPSHVTDQATGDTVGAGGLTLTTGSGNRFFFFPEYAKGVESISNQETTTRKIKPT